MKQKTNEVGVDVSAKELVVKMQRSSDGSFHEGKFDNTSSGHKALYKWSTKNGASARFCMEATGIYHFPLALMLAESKQATLMVVNPRAMKHFSTALMKRAKTDKVDADTILQYLCRMDFVKWQKPTDNILQIQAITRRLHQVKQSLRREQNRLTTMDYRGNSGKIVKKSISTHIHQLEKHVETLQKQFMALVEHEQSTKQKYALLTSINGIADVSASQILAEIITLPSDLSPAQCVAYAGLDPRAIESGSSINKPRKTSKRGNNFLGSALFMPAMVAIRFDPHVKAFYEKLIIKGKLKMQAIVAVMRKLLQCICGMLKSNTKWDGNKFYKIENLA